jgi:hypothetical protein
MDVFRIHQIGGLDWPRRHPIDHRLRRDALEQRELAGAVVGDFRSFHLVAEILRLVGSHVKAAGRRQGVFVHLELLLDRHLGKDRDPRLFHDFLEALHLGSAHGLHHQGPILGFHAAHVAPHAAAAHFSEPALAPAATLATAPASFTIALLGHAGGFFFLLSTESGCFLCGGAHVRANGFGVATHPQAGAGANLQVGRGDKNRIFAQLDRFDDGLIPRRNGGIAARIDRRGDEVARTGAETCKVGPLFRRKRLPTHVLHARLRCVSLASERRGLLRVVDDRPAERAPHQHAGDDQDRGDANLLAMLQQETDESIGAFEFCFHGLRSCRKFASYELRVTSYELEKPETASATGPRRRRPPRERRAQQRHRRRGR